MDNASASRPSTNAPARNHRLTREQLLRRHIARVRNRSLANVCFRCPEPVYLLHTVWMYCCNRSYCDCVGCSCVASHLLCCCRLCLLGST